MQTGKRNSAFELLRIIAMTFIVIWHISYHAQKGELDSHNYITAFCITGVNLFILISGYFGIKTSWKNLLTLVSTIAFYSIVTIALKWSITDTPPDINSIKDLFAPLRESRWWFINCYFILMLLSPIINLALSKSTKQQYIYLLGTLLFISCIQGFCFGNSINSNGYNTFQFVTIYVLGDAINRFDIPARLSAKRLSIIYISLVLSIFTSSFILMPKITFYNNPLVIASAVCLFCLISKIEFHNRTINQIATFMLPIYLLQDSVIGTMAYDYLYKKGLILDFQGFHYFATIGIYILALLGTALVLDSIKRMTLRRPINAMSDFLNKKADIFGHLEQ